MEEDPKKTYLKPAMAIIKNLDNKEELNKAVRDFADVLFQNGEIELAEYTLAQINIGAWTIDDDR